MVGIAPIAVSHIHQYFLELAHHGLMGSHHGFGKIRQWNDIQISNFSYLYNNYNNNNEFSLRNITL